MSQSVGVMLFAGLFLCHVVPSRVQAARTVYRQEDDSVSSEGLDLNNFQLEPWQEHWLQEVFPASGNAVEGSAVSKGTHHQEPSVEASGADGLAQVAANITNAAGVHGSMQHPWSSVVKSEKAVGQGTFGVVYVSKFECNGRPWHCAIKVPKTRASSQELAMMKHEFQIQKLLAQQTGLSADVLDTVEQDRRVYALVEAADGGDLQNFMDKVWTGGLASQDGGELARVIFGQLTYAIAKMHQAGIVHRDLKPANVLINKYICSDKGRVDTAEKWIANGCATKITDFGLSCVVGKTCGGGAMGTPMYMAPRQWLGKVAHPSMDVWALGVIFYKLLFNVYPYKVGSSIEALKAEIMRDASEWSMHLSPTSWWPWALTHQGYWMPAKEVLERTLVRTVRGEDARATAVDLWNSDYVKPTKDTVKQVDAQEMKSPLRTAPSCVTRVTKGWFSWLG